MPLLSKIESTFVMCQSKELGSKQLVFHFSNSFSQIRNISLALFLSKFHFAYVFDRYNQFLMILEHFKAKYLILECCQNSAFKRALISFQFLINTKYSNLLSLILISMDESKSENYFAKKIIKSCLEIIKQLNSNFCHLSIHFRKKKLKLMLFA